MRRWLLRVAQATLVVCAAGGVDSAGQPAAADATPILSVIPADCWAFLELHSLEQFDGQLATFLEQTGLPPVPLADMIETRLQLGPKIPTSGNVAVVFTPAPSLAQLGQRAVLIFPCRSVQDWLGDFNPQKIGDDLWRANLVWGPTFIGHKSEFALFGSTPEAVRAVLRSTRGMSEAFNGTRLQDFRSSDLNLWLRSAELVKRPEVQALLGASRNADARPVFNPDAVLAGYDRLLADIETLHIGVALASAGITVRANIVPRSGSILAKMLDFDAPAGVLPHSLPPEHPVLAAVTGAGSARQMRAYAEALDQLFDTPAITQATAPQRLARFRRALQTAIGRIRGGALGLISREQNPEGLLAVAGVMQVDDAAGWLGELRQAADALSEGFFVDASLNRTYSEVRYVSAADRISGVSVDHLILDLMADEPAPETEELDYGAAWGPPKRTVQLAALDPRTVVLCGSAHPRLMADVIRTAQGHAGTFEARRGLSDLLPLLPESRNLTVIFSPQELIRVGRTLARMQDKVEAFPYRLPELNTPIAAAVSGHPSHCSIQAVVPVDLAGALWSLGRDRPARSSP